MLLPLPNPKVLYHIFESANMIQDKVSTDVIYLNSDKPGSSNNYDYYLICKMHNSNQMCLHKYGHRGFEEALLPSPNGEHVLIRAPKDKDDWLLSGEVDIFTVSKFRKMHDHSNRSTEHALVKKISGTSPIAFGSRGSWNNYYRNFVGWLFAVTAIYEMRANTKPINNSPVNKSNYL